MQFDSTDACQFQEGSYEDQPVIEESWDRPPYGIQDHTHLDVAPSYVSRKSVAGRLGKRPLSIHTTLSELRFVPFDDGDPSLAAPETGSSKYSPISQLRFASPDETMTLLTPIEFEPRSPDSFLSSPTTDFSSPGISEEPAQVTQHPSPTENTVSVPLQPGRGMSGLDESVISDSNFGKRPLPEVPGQAQSRPLPLRPTETEFVQGCSKDPLAASLPVSDHTPEDTSTHHESALATASSPVSPSPPWSPLGSHPTLRSHPSFVIPAPIRKSSKPPVPPPGDLVSPTSIDLVTAAGLTITGENGEQISFGALFGDRKVIVIFVRHFWCLFCQDYVRSISNSVTPEILENKGVDLVLIGNGPPGMIKAYNKTLKFPFKIYTDPSLRLHDALGLYKTGNIQTEGSREQSEGSNYVKRDRRWAMLRVAVKVAAAKAVNIPGRRDPGDPEQLGGEFVFGPGLKSSFVHKMQNPRGHAPILEVLEAAGVDVCERVTVREPEVVIPAPNTPEEVDTDITTTASTSEPSPTPPLTTTATSATTSTPKVPTPTSEGDMHLTVVIPAHVDGSLRSESPTPIVADEIKWMDLRRRSLVRIKQKREMRRGGCREDSCDFSSAGEGVSGFRELV